MEKTRDAEREAMLERIRKLEADLAAAHDRKERAIARAQLTKVGHVYVISNVGAFGDGVLKIGLTRRLDPEERVRELGDASV
ncbi:MAG: GIY-YIG nuclease family protein, partial [Candidatus Tectomicrobia bacterium]|nr:GIY-YIG nuclease family protein [Candidatus Tectomicrobia bacterium]